MFRNINWAFAMVFGLMACGSDDSSKSLSPVGNTPISCSSELQLQPSSQDLHIQNAVWSVRECSDHGEVIVYYKCEEGDSKAFDWHQTGETCL